jgi:hypothetical protein
MLEIAVSDIGLPESPAEANPDAEEGLEIGRTLAVTADELIESHPVDPIHLQKRKPLSTNPDAAGMESEADGEG